VVAAGGATGFHGFFGSADEFLKSVAAGFATVLVDRHRATPDITSLARQAGAGAGTSNQKGGYGFLIFTETRMFRTSRRSWLLGIAALAAHAQQDGTDEPVLDLGAGITPPRLIHQVAPKPDSGDKGFRISGTVLVALVVSSKGLPVNVRVARSVDKEIDQSAVDAVREWRFEPARKDGKPVAVKVTVEIPFQDL